MRGSGAETFLSTEALLAYRYGSGGLALYSPSYDRHEVPDIALTGDGSYQVTVGLIDDHADGCAETIYERLLVERGEAAGVGSADLLITDASKEDVASTACP